MNKVYISVDMEGISGVVSPEQITPGTPEHERACHLVAGDANAAVAGAFDAGCSEVVVVDAHLTGMNIPLEEMDPRADYIIGPNRRVPSWAFLDESYDAFVQVGYHARAGTPNAIWDHTCSLEWLRYIVNGRELGEIGQDAIVTTHYGMPIVFTSGDRAVTEEARALLGDIEVVAVKEGHTRTSGRCMHPQRARALIHAGVARALSRPRDHYRLFDLKPPFEVTIETTTSAQADIHQLNGWTRIDGRTVRTVVDSALDILRP